MHTKKVIPIDAKWAALLREEAGKRETVFPPNAITVEDARNMRKKSGLPSGDRATREWLLAGCRAGKIKRIDGMLLKNGRLQLACRYLVTKCA